jgi:Ni/Fe-hydrogenase subunit HybB-like protein
MADNSKSNGVGFLTLLGLLFVGLKLGKVIAWSWLWVLSPFILKVVIWVTAVSILTYAEVQSRRKAPKLEDILEKIRKREEKEKAEAEAAILRDQPPLQDRDFGVDFLGKSD